MTNKIAVFGLTFVVFVYAVYSLTYIATTYAPDFSVFYDAARGLTTHQNIYAIPMYTGLGYPPFTLLPLLLFTLMPYVAAQSLWVGLSFSLLLISICLSLMLVRKKVVPEEFCAAFILSFMAFPTKFTFGMGQINFMALALLLGGIAAGNRKKSILSGILFGLLFIVKPHFLLFLPILFLAGQDIAAVSSLLVLGTGILVSGVLFGWQQYVYYFRVTVPALLAFAGRGIYYNQGIGSFLSRILPIPLASELTLWISLLLFVSALWYVWRKGLPFINSFIILTPVFLLIEPLSWQHHYVFLLPVYVWLVAKVRKNTHLLLLTAVSYVLVSINIRNPMAFISVPLAGIILSHVFFGNILLLSLVVHETA